MGESQTRFHYREAGGSLTLAPGWETARMPRRAAGHPKAPPAERPEHCSLRARGPGTHACACAHTHSHTDTYIYPHTLSHTHTGPQHTAPHAPARPRSTRLGSAPERPDPAGRLSRAQKRVHTRSHSPRDPSSGSRTATCLGIPAHADPSAARAQSSPGSAVFFMNENVVCK